MAQAQAQAQEREYKVYTEEHAEVVVRTWNTRGDVPHESERYVVRNVHGIQTHPHVLNAFGDMILQSGTIRIAGGQAEVTRWITIPDSDGDCYASEWVTTGALVDGKTYLDADNWNR